MLAPCEEDDQARRFKGVARIRGPSWAHLPSVTIGLLGVQILWSAESSYASPYLLSLGLSKSSLAIVFIAGPLSGLVMQPLIGFLADNSTSRFGRRRPYMLLGTVICIFAMLLLGFTRTAASIFTGWNNSANDRLTVWFAVLSVYLFDFSINAVQAMDRALLVDTLPPSSQVSGNAWAACMLGFGSMVGFFIGNVDLPRILPFLGRTQLQVLSVVVSALFLVGHLVMAVFVKERVLLNDSHAVGKSESSFRQELEDLWTTMMTLPRVIRQICFIQFFAAMSWFPVLFYSTIYIGDLYKQSSPAATTDEEQTFIDTEAMRIGSRALFYSAILTFIINLVLPAFILKSARSSAVVGMKSDNSWGDRICRVPKWMQIRLVTIWAVSHFVFAACMFATFFTQSMLGSMLIIIVTGFPGAVGQWAPFSLLAEAILTETAPHSSETIRLTDPHTPLRRSSDDQERESFLSGRDSDEEDENVDGLKQGRTSNQLSMVDVDHINGDRYGHVLEQGENGREGRRVAIPGHRIRLEGKTLSSKAGIILGIHNIYIVIPQFLVTGFSAILFALIDPQKPTLPGHRVPPLPGRATNLTVMLKNATDVVVRTSGEYMLTRRAEAADTPHSNSVVYIFRIGGIAALIAFVLCWRLAKELGQR